MASNPAFAMGDSLLTYASTVLDCEYAEPMSPRTKATESFILLARKKTWSNGRTYLEPQKIYTQQKVGPATIDASTSIR